MDHDSRKIFFIDPFQAESMTAWWEARGCNSMKHLGEFPFLCEFAELSNVVVRYRDGGTVLVILNTIAMGKFVSDFLQGTSSTYIRTASRCRCLSLQAFGI